MPTESPQPLQRKTLSILCVEDDDAVAKILQMALERFGHTVDIARDGAKGFERVASNVKSYDVVVTDHQMPNMNGLDMVIRLRSVGFQGKIVVHCSPLSRQLGDTYRVLKVDQILQKPVELEAFLKAVEQAGGV